MKTKLLLLIPLLGTGCATQNNHAPVRDVKVQEGQPDYCQIGDNDAEMRRAVKMARKTLGTFVTAVQHPTASQRDFQLKKPFIHNGTLEHIWLRDIVFHGGHFHGKVDNKPQHIPGVKLGDRVSVNANEISDWAFVDNDKLVGSYTIRVLYNCLSPERRKAFEAEANYHITSE